MSGDLKGVNINSDNEPATIVNARGQQRPASYARSEPDIIDAEIVEDEPNVNTVALRDHKTSQGRTFR